ncbi:MAG: hypothetical protein ACLRMJ_06305 [Alistipes finegoldii]
MATGRRCEERNLQQYRGDLPCPRLRQSAFRRREYGLFLVRLPVDLTINSGTLWIRYRVSANVRITANNTITTGGGGSTRLKGTFSVSVADENMN